MEGPIYEDVFVLDRCFVDCVVLYIKLLMSTDHKPEYKVRLLDVLFEASMDKVDEGGIAESRIYIHVDIFDDITAKYPRTRTEIQMKSSPIELGSFIYMAERLFK